MTTTDDEQTLEVLVSRARESVERVVEMLGEGSKVSAASTPRLLESLLSDCDRLRDRHAALQQQGQDDPIIPVTEDEENTTIAALLLDDDDDDDSVVTSRNVVTPLVPKRVCKRSSAPFSEDDFAVQIKKMCALEDDLATQRTKRRRPGDDDPKPKFRRLPIGEESSAVGEDDEDDDEQDPSPPVEAESPVDKVHEEVPRRGGLAAALGKIGLLPPEVALALLSMLNGSDLGRLECCCRATRGSPGFVEIAVLLIKRQQYGVTEMPLLKRETYPHLVCRWEWTRSSKSVSTRTDEVAAALESLDFHSTIPAVLPLDVAAIEANGNQTTQQAVLPENSAA